MKSSEIKLLIHEAADALSHKVNTTDMDTALFEEVLAEHLLPKIEQALLAERRLAMELCAKLAADETINYPGEGKLLHPQTVRSNIERKLRAAAEREVGK